MSLRLGCGDRSSVATAEEVHVIVLTGHIGRQSPKRAAPVHMAPNKSSAPLPRLLTFECHYLANDETLRCRAEDRGWNFVHLSDIALSNDYGKNSCESKSLKFLHHPVVRVLIHNGRRNCCASTRCLVLWIDNKRSLSTENLSRLVRMMHPNSCVMIRQTPKMKRNVWVEFRESNMQRRYRERRRFTEAFIRSFLRKHPGVSPRIPVMNTGLILYDARSPPALRLAERVHRAIVATKSPICQIFWMLEVQRMHRWRERLQIIPYNAMPI